MTSRTVVADTAKAAVLAIAYFCAGKFGLQLAFVHQSSSAVWPCTGIALAAILLGGYRLWPGIWLGAFLVNFTTAGTVLTSIGIATGNTLEAVIGVWLVEHFAHGRHAFERTADILLFILLAAVLSTSLSATIGVTSLALGGFASFDKFFPIWFTWWLGDAVSALLITPLIVVWSTTSLPRLSRKKAGEAALLVTVVWLVTMLGFSDTLPAQASRYAWFLIYPAVLWASYHFGRRGAVSTVLLVAVVAAWGTIQGVGPFASAHPNDSLLLLQTFIITLLITNLILGAVVSERSRAEEALEFASRFPEENPDPVMRLDHGQTVSYLNPAAERLQEFWGLALGKPAPGAIAEIARAVLAEGTKRSVELPSGKQTYLASFAPIAEGGYVNVYFSNITERKRTEEALRESEGRFRTMAESSPVMIWIAGVDKLCTYFNKPWLQFTGRTMEREQGTGWLDGVHPEDLPRCLETYRTSFDDRREFRMEYRLRRHDGEYRWLLDHGAPRFTSNGEFIGYIGSCMDITERRLVEAELEAWRCELELRVEKRTGELALAHKQLQAEMEERKRLENEIALAVEREQLRLGQELHDGLGQQLTGINYMMTVLQMKLRKLSPTRAREARRLQCLIQQSVEQTRVLAKGFYPVELERHGLLVALLEIASRNDVRSETSYSVQSDGDPIAATLKGPLAIQLFRIAQEATHNAAKHARAKDVVIRLGKTDGDIILTVKDNGVGFPSEMDSSKGMGVRIMRHRARMIGGKLDFRNAPEGGSEVTCSVPFKKHLTQNPLQDSTENE